MEPNTVYINPYKSPGYTHELLLDLTKNIASVEWGRWGSCVMATFETWAEKNAFVDIARDAGWIVW